MLPCPGSASAPTRRRNIRFNPTSSLRILLLKRLSHAQCRARPDGSPTLPPPTCAALEKSVPEIQCAGQASSCAILTRTPLHTLQELDPAAGPDSSGHSETACDCSSLRRKRADDSSKSPLRAAGSVAQLERCTLMASKRQCNASSSHGDKASSAMHALDCGRKALTASSTSRKARRPAWAQQAKGRTETQARGLGLGCTAKRYVAHVQLRQILWVRRLPPAQHACPTVRAVRGCRRRRRGVDIEGPLMARAQHGHGQGVTRRGTQVARRDELVVGAVL